MKTVNILLVDPNVLMREAIKNLLNKYGKYQIVGEAGTGEEAIIKAKQHNVHTVIVNMDDIDGVTCVSAISGLFPEVKAIALSSAEETNDIAMAMKAGAKGYLLLSDVEEELYMAIEMVHGNRLFYCDRLKHKQWEVSHLNKRGYFEGSIGIRPFLTDREKQVLQLIFRQFTNDEIAEELNISARTVDTHKRNMLEKTGVKNMAGLLMYVLTNNVLNVSALA